MSQLQTRVLAATGREDDPAVGEAARLLQAGELVAIPTETVYGLAANALDPRAVAKIFEAKGRPQDNPLIAHISALEDLKPLVSQIPEGAVRLAEAFWPGPLTMVLPRSRLVPDIVTAGLDTVAVRFPSHPVAQAVIRAAGAPLAAPSANLSGRPSPTSAQHCVHDLGGKIPLILDGGPCAVGVESTVVTLATPVPRLLRPGAITPHQLQELLGVLAVDPAVFEELHGDGPAASPGMKYIHYSPKARVIMMIGPWEDCKRVLSQQRPEGVWALIFDENMEDCPIPAVSLGPEGDAEQQARRLFSALRDLDEKQAELVFARAPSDLGVGLAVYNRLIRAAGFTVMDLTVGY